MHFIQYKSMEYCNTCSSFDAVEPIVLHLENNLFSCQSFLVRASENNCNQRNLIKEYASYDSFFPVSSFLCKQRFIHRFVFTYTLGSNRLTK
jgi:hypothetical protein